MRKPPTSKDIFDSENIVKEKSNISEKIRCLFFTDTHYTYKTPISRLEGIEYLNTLLAKTQEVFDIGKENNVDCYIHGGDFFDSPDISDSVAGTVGELYSTLDKPIYVIAGNHDLIGNNINTLYQTKLGLLSKLKIITLINRYEPVFLEKANKKLQITGSPSDFGIDLDKSAYIVENKNADFSLHIVHAMLLKEKSNITSYVPLSNIQDSTMADVTLSGHFHLGFDTLKNNNKFFANPGALIRKTALKEEIKRMPKVIIVEFDCNTNKVELKEVFLKTAQKGEDVIDRTKLENSKDFEEKIMNFRMSLMNKTFSANADLTKILEVIQKEEHIEGAVMQEVAKRLDIAKTGIKENNE